MPDKTPMDAWTGRARAVLPAASFGNFGPSIMIRQDQGSRVRDERGIIKSPGKTYPHHALSREGFKLTEAAIARAAQAVAGERVQAFRR